MSLSPSWATLSSRTSRSLGRSAACLERTTSATSAQRTRTGRRRLSTAPCGRHPLPVERVGGRGSASTDPAPTFPQIPILPSGFVRILADTGSLSPCSFLERTSTSYSVSGFKSTNPHPVRGVANRVGDVLILIGADRSGRILEVGAVDDAECCRIIHAMPARAKHLR